MRWGPKLFFPIKRTQASAKRTKRHCQPSEQTILPSILPNQFSILHTHLPAASRPMSHPAHSTHTYYMPQPMSMTEAERVRGANQSAMQIYVHTVHTYLTGRSCRPGITGLRRAGLNRDGGLRISRQSPPTQMPYSGTDSSKFRLHTEQRKKQNGPKKCKCGTLQKRKGEAFRV